MIVYMRQHALKQQANKLRRAGYSYSYIKDRTGVSKSTLSNWLAHIPYQPNQETIEHIGLARARSGEQKSSAKRKSIENAQAIAREDIEHINSRDLFMLGLGLYLGEGTKTHDIVRIINANPQIVKLALLWFKSSCGLSKSNFSIRLHVYPDNDVSECVQYWSRTTGISASQFQKTQIDRRVDKKASKRGKLPYGTAHLSIRSNGEKEFGVHLARKINAWMSEVMVKAGIV